MLGQVSDSIGINLKATKEKAGTCGVTGPPGQRGLAPAKAFSPCRGVEITDSVDREFVAANASPEGGVDTSVRDSRNSIGNRQRPVRVVYFDHTAELGGAEIALADLVRHLDRTRIEP